MNINNILSQVDAIFITPDSTQAVLRIINLVPQHEYRIMLLKSPLAHREEVYCMLRSQFCQMNMVKPYHQKKKALEPVYLYWTVCR